MTDQPQPNIEEFAIAVEWPHQPGGIQKASRGEDKMQAQVEKAVNRAMGTINYMAHRVAQTMQGIGDKARPDEAEVEFGINLDVESGALLAKTSVGAQLTVTLKWKIEQPERTNVLVSEGE